jgi:hypothetical protein
MTETSYDEVLRHGLKVLDRLHRLLTAEELSDGWRDELDTAIAVAASLLDQADQLAADEPRDAATAADGDGLAGKRCPRCDTTKPTGEFSANRNKHDRCQSYCKPCVREMNRADRRAGRYARRITVPTGDPPPQPDADTPRPVHAASQRAQRPTEVVA